MGMTIRNLIASIGGGAIAPLLPTKVLYLSGSSRLSPASVLIPKGQSISGFFRVLDTSAARCLFSAVATPNCYTFISATGTITSTNAETIKIDGFDTNIWPTDGDMHKVEITFKTDVYLDRFGLGHTGLFPLNGQLRDLSFLGETYVVDSGTSSVVGSQGTTLTLTGGTWQDANVQDYGTYKNFTGAAGNFKQIQYVVPNEWNAILICGQSNGAGSTPIVPPNEAKFSGQSKRYQPGVGGGPLLDQKEYLNHTIASSKTQWIVGNYRENGSYQPLFITQNHAVGGRSYAEIKKGGTEPLAYAKFITDLTAMRTLKPTVVRCFNLVHGEADLVNPWETYRDNLIQFLTDYTTDCKAITGQTYDPIMIVSQISSQKVYQPTDVESIKSPLALLDVCRVSSRHYSCGPQYWCETNGGLDQYHLSGKDQILSGEYRAEVYNQVVERGDTTTPTATIPVSATLGANFIDVLFEVNKAPLQWDTEYIPAIANNGFVYSDGSGNTITSVEIRPDGQTVRINLSGTAGANPDLQYAWHNGNANCNGVVSGGPRGTLCDSNSHASRYYPAYKMRRYALAFRYGAGYLSFS